MSRLQKRPAENFKHREWPRPPSPERNLTTELNRDPFEEDSNFDRWV